MGEYILHLRGKRVILDTDLAKLYGVTTKALNQAVKRNIKRFPADFLLQVASSEKEELVTICDRFRNIKHSSSLPYAFTEHGVIMAASVLNSDRAIDASTHIVRAFVKLRQLGAAHAEFFTKLNQLEQRVAAHDSHIRSLFETLRRLMEPPTPTRRQIGFRMKESTE